MAAWQVPVQVVVAIEDNRTDGYMEQMGAPSGAEKQLPQDSKGNRYIDTSSGSQVFAKMRNDLEV